MFRLTDPLPEHPAGVADGVREAPVVMASLDSFLASVERPALRLAELGLGNRDDALDAVQEAMIGLVRYGDRPPAEWPALFWSILRRQLTDRHRRESVKRKVFGFLGRPDAGAADAVEAFSDPGQGPEQRHEEDRKWRALGAAVRSLPARQRECFLLRELQGLGVAETAQAMGCSEGSVKTHLHRANAALREMLEEWR